MFLNECRMHVSIVQKRKINAKRVAYGHQTRKKIYCGGRECIRASREIYGNQRLENLPTCYYKYVYVILCIQSCPILRGINILSSTVLSLGIGFLTYKVECQSVIVGSVDNLAYKVRRKAVLTNMLNPNSVVE